MQNRRHFLTTGLSMAAAGFAGAAALTGARRSLAEEAPPETTSLRLPQYSATCFAPVYILHDLLREEGFADVRYVRNPGTTSEIFARGEVDFTQDFSPVAIGPIDAGAPIVMLAGVHSGCFELFARESIRSVGDLKGRKVGVPPPWAAEAQQIIVSIIVASVGLDPVKDIDWVVHAPPDAAQRLDKGEIDAFLAVPPWAQELHARDFGRTILNSTLDRPWSEYLCCMLIGHADFVRRHPIATKRVVRAMVRATDICAAKPDWVAQSLVDRGFTPRYDYARQGLAEISYRSWREYDAEDSVRFWALRMREIGMIKSSPDKIIAMGTNWRFIKEVRRELGI